MEKDGERNSDVFDLFISVTRYIFVSGRVNKWMSCYYYWLTSKRVNELLLQSLSTRQTPSTRQLKKVIIF